MARYAFKKLSERLWIIVKSVMLSDAQLQFFEKNGYIVLEDVLDQASVVAPIKHEYAMLLDQLCAGWINDCRLKQFTTDADFEDKLLAAYLAGCDWFQPMDISLPGDRIAPDTPMHFGPAVFALLTNEHLLDVVASIIGEEITSNPIQHVRIKPPATKLDECEIRAHITATDWHQDRGVTHAAADNTKMITVWCAISDATPDNGCLQVIPGGHTSGILPHCPKTQTAIADGFINEDDAIPLPVKSGGIIIFHPLVPHSSLPNDTSGFRWSFDIRYNQTGQPTGRSHFPEFVARSVANPALELTEWRKWRSLWEEARSRLSGQPHIDIHRWASDAPHCA